MSKQYGFYYDVRRCVQCRTCEVACKSIRNIEPGVKLRRVVETWSGEYPGIIRAFFSLACMQCGKPACKEVCPTGAISKRAEDGIVVVDRDKCNGCQDCYVACPYDVPQFGNDGTMQKCDFCIDTDTVPACARHCPAEALHYGTMEELAAMAKEKPAQKLTGPTEPSIFILSKPGDKTIQNMLNGK